MRALILHNDTSGYGSDAIYMFQRSLLRHGDECTLHMLDPEHHELPADLDAGSYDIVVVSSGDSTVASVLGQLQGIDTPVCIFPSGTANLFFANLGNSPEPASIARACRVGRTVPTDIGRIDWTDDKGEARSEYFTIMAGTGFDAELMKAAVPNKSQFGQAAYFLAALADPNPPVAHFTLEIDGDTVERDGIACIVANTAMIQGDIEIVPDCTIDDGYLDVILLETPDAITLMRPVVAALLDPRGTKVGRPHIESFKGRVIKVSSSVPIPIQIDGDPAGDDITGFTARVIPAAHRVVVDGMSRYHEDTGEGPRFSGTEVPAYPDE
jgi:diacylglycerol kinase family enzyme